MPTIRKILIANRAEIAVRVMRACHELNIGSVAVHSDADRLALHTRLADEAYGLDGNWPPETYLDMEKLLRIAKASHCDAVHPGYGFLSENPDFAQACEDAGLIFIGPPAKVLRLTGNKISSRQIALAAKARIVPGTPDPITDLELARKEARRVGYPVLVKAAAAGGGRGIYRANDDKDLEESIAASRRIAKSTFGQDAVLLEKFLENVHHIEAQIMGDSRGRVACLGTRECSVQRRRQKLVEESPPPSQKPKLLETIMQTATRIGERAGYQGAGTVEFLVDGKQNFYFLEVNSRLQVEHPVTEMVTGMDLVKEQIRIAEGADLGYKTGDIPSVGAAIECRICAEDADKDFAPSMSDIDHVQEPSGPGVRVDSMLLSNMPLPHYYDSLLSKLITWGRTRNEAVARMRRALHEYIIEGATTLIPFHLKVMENELFLSGNYDTSLVERMKNDSKAGP